MNLLPELSSGAQKRLDILVAYRFPRWKRPVVRQCFPDRKILFRDKVDTIPLSASLLLWGMAPVPDGLAPETRVFRIEDGFLRSVGLGAELARPVSWVVDGQGIYFDATRSSDLEQILAESIFDEALRSRGAALRARVVALRLTKYNVGNIPWQRPAQVSRVILVPGQVESDASLMYGAPGERSNMGLLQAVRQSNPDAYVIYKPHPDVEARLRLEGQGEREAYRWCDEVVIDANMADMLAVVDELHVLTSLAGFEGLLRGKPVTCYGQPFYSGWGLTSDVIPNRRRVRKLSLDELVAGVLIKYPLYLSRDGRCLISAEQALDALLAWREKSGGQTPWWQEIYRVYLRLIFGVR